MQQSVKITSNLNRFQENANVSGSQHQAAQDGSQPSPQLPQRVADEITNSVESSSGEHSNLGTTQVQVAATIHPGSVGTNRSDGNGNIVNGSVSSSSSAGGGNSFSGVSGYAFPIGSGQMQYYGAGTFQNAYLNVVQSGVGTIQFNGGIMPVSGGAIPVDANSVYTMPSYPGSMLGAMPSYPGSMLGAMPSYPGSMLYSGGAILFDPSSLPAGAGAIPFGQGAIPFGGGLMPFWLCAMPFGPGGMPVSASTQQNGSGGMMFGGPNLFQPAIPLPVSGTNSTTSGQILGSTLSQLSQNSDAHQVFYSQTQEDISESERNQALEEAKGSGIAGNGSDACRDKAGAEGRGGASEGRGGTSRGGTSEGRGGTGRGGTGRGGTGRGGTGRSGTGRGGTGRGGASQGRGGASAVGSGGAFQPSLNHLTPSEKSLLSKHSALIKELQEHYQWLSSSYFALTQDQLNSFLKDKLMKLATYKIDERERQDLVSLVKKL